MRTIQKGAEPHSLIEHRLQAHADYDNYTDKDTLRNALVEEQKGLCCYCQSRIRPNRESMKIEHWRCQTNYPDMQLAYSNLLGSCLGGEGRPFAEQHCDTRKGNTDICFCLTDPSHPIEHNIRFLGNGEITSDDPAIKADLNDVLNLNWTRLVANRKAVVDAFQQRLGRGPLNVEREIRKWDGSQSSELPEYAGIVVFWLRKKIDRNRA